MPTQTIRLNIEKQDQGDTNWKGHEDDFKDKVDQVSAQYLTVRSPGLAVDEEVIFDGFKFDEDVDISGMTVLAREAPTGSALTVDFLSNQTEQVKLATLSDGATKQHTSIAGLAFTSLQECGLKIKSIGSTEPGNELTCIIHYNVKPVV